MSESTYKYSINQVVLSNENSFIPGRINVFVGANNCGKTQALRDIYNNIIGKKDTPILIKELDILYPESWEAMSEAYNMNVENVNQLQQLKHISPTFDSDPPRPSSYDLLKSLKNNLKNDKRAFRALTGYGFVSYLNTENRLKLVLKQPVQADLNTRGAKNSLEALYLSGKEQTNKLRQYIKRIFAKDIYLDVSNLGSIQFKVGDDFSSIPDDPRSAFTDLAEFPLLDEQGDGLRSVVGMLSAIISVNKPIILLDEPEAFLHPPQALQLGAIISELINDGKQIFIATHSADFIRGLIGVNNAAVIVHINRSQNNHTDFRVLNPDSLHKIVTDPLLSSSRVLEGMFYKGVVATEADADTVFYQRLFQKIGASDEIHFINAHNKQTLKKIIAPYQELGIKLALIADADVIRDRHEFKDILQIIPDDGSLRDDILHQRDILYNFFESKSNYDILINLQNEIKKLATCELPINTDKVAIDKALADFRSQLKILRDDSDVLADYKSRGRNSLSEEQQRVFDIICKKCAAIGFFIVYVGELESWLEDYGIHKKRNKAKWISDALDAQFSIEYDSSKNVWKFINSLRNYLTN